MNELEHNMRRYLLGELSEQERAALEEKYFRDPQVFNEVLRVESELVDAYARGQLSVETRERFEQFYLKHPARRDRVEFATALTTRIDERDAPVVRAEQSASRLSWKERLLGLFGAQGPRLRFAMALVLVAIALAGVWIFINNRRRQPQSQAAQTQSAQQTEKQEERAAQVPPDRPQPSPNSNTHSAPRTVSLALTVSGVRSADGGATPTLVIPPDTTEAQLVLELKDDSYPHYRVSLRQIGGPEIFTQTNVRPRGTKAGARFVFKVPTKQLTKGDYVLTLGGITPAGEVDDLSKSLFRVEKR